MEASKQYHESMQAVELWKHASSRTMKAWKQQNPAWKHANSRNEGCKEQNHGCMQAAEMKHAIARSRTMVAAELWKHAIACKQQNYVEACRKQQNYGSMPQAAELWKHASSRTIDCSSIEYM